MGHLGFVPVSAVRLDAADRLWVDRDAPAPQRQDGGAVLAIRRTVDLTLELVITRPVVGPLDRHLRRLRPPLLDIREEPITTVRGLRHYPRLASAVQR
jgi:hypothetical protein